MHEGLVFENSFVVDRSWEKANPTASLTVSPQQAEDFLQELLREHAVLGASVFPSDTLENMQDNVHDFVSKYAQEKELKHANKR